MQGGVGGVVGGALGAAGGAVGKLAPHGAAAAAAVPAVREVVKGVARGAAEKVIGSQNVTRVLKALAPNRARESWLREVMPEPYGVAPEEAARLVGTKAPPKITFAPPVEDVAPKSASKALAQLAAPPPAPAAPTAAVDDTVAALDLLERAPRAEMPAEVMAAEVPKAQVFSRPPKITGSGEQIVAHVKSLPPEQRLPFLRRVKADMGDDVARKVAKAAGVSVKLGL